jgi:GNAT superfamily N-acetyltransferase
MVADRAEVRAATKSDMPEIARLFKLSRESQLPYLPQMHTPEEDVAYFSVMVYGEQSVYLIEDNERLLGFIAYDQSWVHHLYIHPNELGKGFGAKLLKLAMQNASILQLWAFKKNTRAINFYKKHGFVLVKETDGSENEEKEPDVLMEWRGAWK